jgi:hypothetical protein
MMYAVATADGAIYLVTEDKAQAIDYAEWLNAKMGDILEYTASTHDPGAAAVYEELDDGSLVELADD